jgi:hypothetical protein
VSFGCVEKVLGAPRIKHLLAPQCVQVLPIGQHGDVIEGHGYGIQASPDHGICRRQARSRHSGVPHLRHVVRSPLRDLALVERGTLASLVKQPYLQLGPCRSLCRPMLSSIKSSGVWPAGPYPGTDLLPSRRREREAVVQQHQIEWTPQRWRAGGSARRSGR